MFALTTTLPSVIAIQSDPFLFLTDGLTHQSGIDLCRYSSVLLKISALNTQKTRASFSFERLCEVGGG